MFTPIWSEGHCIFFQCKKEEFPKVSERGHSHDILRRCMQITQTETESETDHFNMTLCISFYSNRFSTLPPPQHNRQVRRIIMSIAEECSKSPSMAVTVNRMAFFEKCR